MQLHMTMLHQKLCTRKQQTITNFFLLLCTHTRFQKIISKCKTSQKISFIQSLRSGFSWSIIWNISVHLVIFIVRCIHKHHLYRLICAILSLCYLIQKCHTKCSFIVFHADNPPPTLIIRTASPYFTADRTAMCLRTMSVKIKLN